MSNILAFLHACSLILALLHASGVLLDELLGELPHGARALVSLKHRQQVRSLDRSLFVADPISQVVDVGRIDFRCSGGRLRGDFCDVLSLLWFLVFR